uniref:Gypsy retrotransposon integrase-like protein 1 n=1 Tax=Nothobranchius furzeri TaxID=105023 RepID=A0A8C6M5V1_NOTFU
MLDQSVVQDLDIPTILLPTPLRASSLDGNSLTTITHQTVPVSLLVSGNHQESISFFVFPSPHSPVVLGYDWLVKHNPQINWKTSRVTVWSSHCLTDCLRSAPPICSAPTADSPVPPDLSEVPKEYHDLALVFSKDRASSLPPHRPYDCAIDLLPGATLPSSRLYNLSKPEQLSMSTYINESLASGIIRPSTSPLGAGFFFVTKKDGSLRPCIDYRGLNQITVKNKYPLPLLSSTFEPVKDATIFTKLDLRNAYHLVRIREGDEWKTAFKTPLGHFESLVMPFGLTNAPAVFQSLVNSVLGDYLNQFVTVYLDDILIFSRSPAEHRQHVKCVLQRLLENRLYVKAEKCEFHVPSVKFLGFILESGRLKTDPEKIKSVLSWPTPTTCKQLQRFLGFANFYRRFIKNYSQTAAPLTQLTSINKPFIWSPSAEESFQALKDKFTQAPILTRPDTSAQFTLEVDASDSGVGAVLSQVSPSDHRLHPCAFFSRRLSPAEKNYDVGDRELLAIKLALEEWRHWLEGAEHPIIIWTDHKNLAYLKEAKRLNPRQSRWSLFFSRFHFLISFRPGSKNTKPDALSRLYSPDKDPYLKEAKRLNPRQSRWSLFFSRFHFLISFRPGSKNTKPDALSRLYSPDKDPESAPILPPSCIVGAVDWDITKKVQDAQQTEPDPGTGPPHKVYVPTRVRGDLIHWAHTAKFSIHPGVGRTLALIRRTFWWPSMYKDVREYISACSICARNKNSNQPPAGLLNPLPVPTRPWSHIALDFVTGLPPL